MPMSGGTRMLRARRKDCNIKPNRRLDRKSSRGMLFENEELRMRTITINAEVEQGQHALKKLRRENEQLRREMWCLRDEYDKMEKLLRRREEGEESDQENSDSDDNCSLTNESDEEKRTLRKKSDNPDLEIEENSQKFSQFGNETNVRTFDGLSVIDEQTEETQTTESAVGYGTLSRGNSANRTFNQSTLMQEEACRVPDFSSYGYGIEPYEDKIPMRKKGICSYENGSGYPNDWAMGQCDTYEVRPASPYPYNGSFRPSYQKRFQVLQEMPLIPQTPANGIGENGWIFPDPSKISEIPNYYLDDPVNFSENYLPEKPPDGNICPGSLDYNLIQDRGGPDVFVTGGYAQMNTREASSGPIQKIAENTIEEEEEDIINNVKAEICEKTRVKWLNEGNFGGDNGKRKKPPLKRSRDPGLKDKIEINQNSEMDPKIQKMTTLTKSALPRGEAGLTSLRESQETLDPGKLTMDEAVDKNDNEISKRVQHLVTCQNSNGQHVRETIETVQEADSSNNPPADEMPQIEKPGSSKYQTKLLVTLKAPGVRPEGKTALKKVSGPVPPRNFQPQFRGYGIKPEYSMNQRFQTFPSPGFQPNVRMPVTGGRDCLVNHYAGVRVPGGGLSESLPRLPTVPKTDFGLSPSNIPDELDKELDVLPDEESLPVPVTQSLVKPVKIPPVPPPRTSSCPKPIIPAPPIGATALQQRNFRKGKPLHQQDSFEKPSEKVFYNPLLMSQPIATSSPTISLRGTKGQNSSSENLYNWKCRKQSYQEDSSLEEFSKQKSQVKEDIYRADVPKLNKSLSSPSFGSFRTLRRKQSEAVAASVENILAQKIPEAISLSEKPEKKISKNQGSQNNASVSSSSGLDSPAKSDRRKRRVSIQFKKKQSQSESKHVEDEGGGKDSLDSRRDSIAQGILSIKTKTKSKNDETDATTSERERTNSVSSRTSSVMAGSSRRKYSISSNKTYLNDEKIPWCGCWGNGCV